jgi:glycosyltransferase involved in cell wall biosynthesis
MSIFCLIQARNEQRFLPGFLHHIAPYVDGIVALDDCSTDSTPDILRREPMVLSVLHERRAGPAHSHEVSNRHRLLLEAARLGARWVLCADADERFEEGFLRRVRTETRKGEWFHRQLCCVRLVNLWDAPDQYRLDGRCGPRWTVRMFRIPASITARRPGMHQPWFPPELDGVVPVRMRAILYHLRMIDRADREARFLKFSAVDPHAVEQAIGYGHMVDETGLKLRRISPRRCYVDPPAASEDQRPLPIPARTGCRADAAFVRRFRLDPDSREGPRANVVTPTRSLFGRRKQPAFSPERSRFYGFDFEAIFADLQARNHDAINRE